MKKNAKASFLFVATGIVMALLTGCAVSSGSENVSKDQNQPAASNTDEQNQSESSADSQQIPSVSSSVSNVNSISVNSSEKVTVVPDIAQVEYSVRTEAGDAAACQQKNTEAVSQVIELLKTLNVDEASIQTSDYYMNPVYNYSGNTPRVTGYEAVTTLTVSDLPIDGLDKILSQSVSNGINTIRSITYQASKYDESYQQALTAAVESAHRKAEALADAAGCQVGSVINIRETSGYSQERYSDYALTGRYAAAKQEMSMAMEDSAGIMPGEIQVEASIVVEYQIY
mgnify:CR=1 FL=1